MIRVLLADDQALIRTGLRMIIDAQPDLEVVAEAADGREAVDEAIRVLPDVVIMDIRMPRMDGVEATRRLSAMTGHPPGVLVLTTFDLDDVVFDALRAGARGFLLKDAPPAELLAAIRIVASGDALIAPSITRRLIASFVDTASSRARSDDRLAQLTAREREVLVLLGRGLSNAQIADVLVLGENTVKTHVSRVLDKLGVANRVQAAIAAYEAGLIGGDEVVQDVAPGPTR